METQNHHSGLFAGLAMVISSAAMGLSVQAQADSNDSDVNRDILQQVQRLYGLDEDRAIERLAREELAAETYLRIRSLDLKSYAGAWFDEKTLSLQVAISDEKQASLVSRMGAVPTVVARSLDELENAREDAHAALNSGGDVELRESYIDYRLNRVVIAVAPGVSRQAQTLFDSRGLSRGEIEVIEQTHRVEFSSGPVRGANGTRNYTWQQQYSVVSPCSIGVAIVGGYVTAGHCGMAGHQIRTPTNQSLGTVAASNLQLNGLFSHNEDGAWVQTVSGWNPVPQINGYTDGILSVPARWAGVLESPVGATVCRYGQTSGGPHCGTIEQKNYNFYMQGNYFMGFVKAAYVCTHDGDSGGPYISATGQVQGTNTGGSPTNNCLNPQGYYFAVYQPITIALSRFGASSSWLRMLTAHGAAKPTIHDTSCWGTGWGTYSCWLGYFDSQGKTEFIWYSNSAGIGNTHEGLNFSEYCYPPGDQVGVSLHVSNPYGTTSWYTTFACPFN